MESFGSWKRAVGAMASWLPGIYMPGAQYQPTVRHPRLASAGVGALWRQAGIHLDKKALRARSAQSTVLAFTGPGRLGRRLEYGVGGGLRFGQIEGQRQVYCSPWLVLASRIDSSLGACVISGRTLARAPPAEHSVLQLYDLPAINVDIVAECGVGVCVGFVRLRRRRRQPEG